MSTPTVTPTAPAPADNGIRSWQINGAGVRVQTGIIKGGKKAGTPQFRFIYSVDEPNTLPNWAALTGLVAQLGVADKLAAVVQKEILGDLAKEVSARITEKTPEGVLTLNSAKVAETTAKVVDEYLAEKEGAKTLLAEIAELNDEYRKSADVILQASLKGQQIKGNKDLEALANKIAQVTLKIGELQAKLENMKRKKPAAAAPAAVPAAAPAAA